MIRPFGIFVFMLWYGLYGRNVICTSLTIMFLILMTLGFFCLDAWGLDSRDSFVNNFHPVSSPREMAPYVPLFSLWNFSFTDQKRKLIVALSSPAFLTPLFVQKVNRVPEIPSFLDYGFPCTSCVPVSHTQIPSIPGFSINSIPGFSAFRLPVIRSQELWPVFHSSLFRSISAIVAFMSQLGQTLSILQLLFHVMSFFIKVYPA